MNLPAAAASDKINLKEWAEHLCKSIGAEIVEEKDEVIRCEAKADTENNKFPLKVNRRQCMYAFAAQCGRNRCVTLPSLLDLTSSVERVWLWTMTGINCHIVFMGVEFSCSAVTTISTTEPLPRLLEWSGRRNWK